MADRYMIMNLTPQPFFTELLGERHRASEPKSTIDMNFFDTQNNLTVLEDTYSNCDSFNAESSNETPKGSCDSCEKNDEPADDTADFSCVPPNPSLCNGVEKKEDALD